MAYFLSMSVEPPDRAACEGPLLQAYTDALAERGVRYDVADVWADYQAAVGYSLCLAVGLGGSPGLDSAPPRKRALAAAVARRISAALVETGAADLLVSLDSEDVHIGRKRGSGMSGSPHPLLPL